MTRLARNGPIHPAHGVKLQYINPVNGGPAMPTLAVSMQLLPAQFNSRPYRSTDSTVFVVVEGQGYTKVGDQVLEWKAHDVFVVPSWYTVSHHCEGEAVLFSYSNRPVQKAMGIWREEEM